MSNASLEKEARLMQAKARAPRQRSGFLSKEESDRLLNKAVAPPRVEPVAPPVPVVRCASPGEIYRGLPDPQTLTADLCFQVMRILTTTDAGNLHGEFQSYCSKLWARIGELNNAA